MSDSIYNPTYAQTLVSGAAAIDPLAPAIALEPRPEAEPEAHLGHDRSLRTAVQAHIFAEIQARRLGPGDRLREAELAERLGVSLTPVREAILGLARDGVVIHRPRRGFFLVELGPEQIQEVFEFRAALEGLAAGFAARRIRPEEVRELESLIAEGERAARAGDPLGNAECNARFHTLIVRAARYSLVTLAWRTITPLRWLLLPAGVPAMDAAETADWVNRHRRLLEAIRSGDALAAETEARLHVLRSAERPAARVAARGGGPDARVVRHERDGGEPN